MAGLQSEKKPDPSGFDVYSGTLNGKVLGTDGSGKMDRFQGWSRYNTVHGNEARISSFSKEDTLRYSFLYGEGFHGDSPKNANKTNSGCIDNGSTHGAGSPEYVTGSTQEDGATLPIKSLRSCGGGVPPLAGGSPGSGRVGNSATHSNARDDTSSPGVPMHGRSSSTDDSFRKEHHGTHRRQMSDVGSGRVESLLNGEARRNVSGEIFSSGSSTGGSTPRTGSDSSRYWSRSDSGRFSSETTSSSGGSPSVFSLKVGSNPVVDSPSPRASSSSSGGSSRGSSIAGSPTVGRTSSAGNLFGSGRNGTGAGATETSSTMGPGHRSASCNVGNLRASISSGGGLFTSGGATKPTTTSRGTQNGGISTSIGIITGPNSSARASNGGAVKANVKPEGLKASPDVCYARGNIFAVGESLLIKRMLSSSDPEEVKNAGNDQHKKGNFAEALSLYDRAISLAPGRASYRSNRAAALIGLGRLAEAYKECEESIRLDPFYVRAQLRLGSLCIRLGRVERARKLFKSCGQQIDPGDIQRLERIEKHWTKCLEARRASDWVTVVRESEAAVGAGADSSPQILALKAEALLKLCRPEEADIVIQAAQKVEGSLRKSTGMPVDTITLCVQAQIDMALGRFDDAVVLAEKAVHFDPHNLEVSNLLRRARALSSARAAGNDLYKAGRVLEAAVAYGEGLQYNPTNAVLLCNRAACRSKLGLNEKAIEDCNAALDAQPHYLKALLRRANSYSKLEQWKDALRDYERLKRELPGDVEVLKAHFDAQVALKKQNGENSVSKWFGGVIEEVSSNDQLREALTHPGLAVVLFNTRWSDRCRQMVPFVDRLCKRNPTVNFLEVDVEANAYLAKAESVEFVPTFKIYKNGFKVKELLGPTPEALEHAISHFSL